MSEKQKARLPDQEELIKAIERGDTDRADEIRRRARQVLPDAMAEEAECELDRLAPMETH